MTYRVQFSRQAFKELERLNEPFHSNIRQAISHLAQNPRPHGFKKLKGRNGYRIRIGDYRVIYEIFDAELLIDVITFGHRKDIYE